MNFIKHQLLGFFSDIGKSVEDIDYYRISPHSKQPTIKGKSNNIFESLALLDSLATINHLSLGIIVFHDNTWIEYDAYDHAWAYNFPPSYDELINGALHEWSNFTANFSIDA